MSYCFDVLERTWETLRQQLPKDVRDDELATRFGFLLSEIHEANHRLNDGINKDARVTKQASQLDKAASNTALDDA
jgi:hypothetical protein